MSCAFFMGAVMEPIPWLMILSTAGIVTWFVWVIVDGTFQDPKDKI